MSEAQPTTEALATFKALADSTRLRILRSLVCGPFHVNELVAILGAGQSTVSRHLRLLADAGLVECRRTKTWAYYSLAKDGKGFSSRQLDALEAAWAESPNPDRRAIDAVLARRRDATADFFRRSATDWDRLRDDLLGPSAHVDRLVDVVRGAPVAVDLGTGTGILLKQLAPHVGSLIGVDASPEMLHLARARIREDRLSNADLRLGTLEHLPLSDGEANAMVANLVLHHVADIGPVLREMRRTLAPAGRLVIAELTGDADESFWKSLGAQRPGFRPEELRHRLESEGFRVTRLEEIDSPSNGNGARPHVFLAEAARAE